MDSSKMRHFSKKPNGLKLSGIYFSQADFWEIRTTSSAKSRLRVIVEMLLDVNLHIFPVALVRA